MILRYKIKNQETGVPNKTTSWLEGRGTIA